MNEPELVVDCIKSMKQPVEIPITVKCRIGVDDNSSYENLYSFIQHITSAGLDTIIIHARIALLKGLSPKQNRSIPPLNYDFVYRIKQQLHELNIIINGGIQTVEQVNTHLNYVDGVMLGKAVWKNPWLLYDLQQDLFNTSIDSNRDYVLEQYKEYCEGQIQLGVKLHWLIPPILNLFHSIVGNIKWINHLVTQSAILQNDFSVLYQAIKLIHLDKFS